MQLQLFWKDWNNFQNSLSREESPKWALDFRYENSIYSLLLYNLLTPSTKEEFQETAP